MTVGRFAPSPSGRMHLGNLFTALLAWCSVRRAGGRMLLRIEDLDPLRSSEDFADLIREDLRWLGLDWDAEQPQQSRRTEAYRAALASLDARGLVYPCYCSRSELHAVSAPHVADGSYFYPGTCRSLTPEQRAAKKRPPAMRLTVPDETVRFVDLVQGPYAENLARDCGDFILRRSDGVFAYQLAVCCDDGAGGVSEVVRGADLISSTPRQIWLLGLLGFAAPRYAHVPLLVAPDGRRLSKRDRDLDLGALRARMTPEALIGRLGFLAGQLERPEPLTAAELASVFTWERVPRGPLPVALGEAAGNRQSAADSRG